MNCSLPFIVRIILFFVELSPTTKYFAEHLLLGLMIVLRHVNLKVLCEVF